MGEKLVVLDYGRERLYTEGREESQGASRAAEEITCVGYHHRHLVSCPPPQRRATLAVSTISLHAASSLYHSFINIITIAILLLTLCHLKSAG
jgi:hypothetical protein